MEGGPLYLNNQGKMVVFPLEKFIKDICSGEVCFLCGVTLENYDASKEHVLPDWLLRRFDLYDSLITLPNGQSVRYSSYTVPCCDQCNADLGKCLETPISRLFSKSYDEIIEYIKEEGPWLIIAWLALIFFKTHYRDLNYRVNLDKREGEERIGDSYEWEDLHHIYMVARSVYIGAKVDSTALSTFVIVPTKLSSHNFDYSDLFISKSIFIRFGSFAIIAILNDGCGVFTLNQDIGKIKAPLNYLQLRELFARMSYENLIIRERPKFHTVVDQDNPNGIMFGETPEHCSVTKPNWKDYGALLYGLIKDYLRSFTDNDSKVLQAVKEGNFSFLYNENGSFVDRDLE